MIVRFRSLTLTALGLGALAFSAGCEVEKCETEDGREATCAESLERYTVSGAEETRSEPYEPGMGLVVDNIKGNIFVDVGNPGEISVTFDPFTYRGHSKDEEARNEIENLLDKQVYVEGTNIKIVTYQMSGASDELGATLYVTIPPEFDGALSVFNQAAGNIEEADVQIDNVASAYSVEVESDGLGDCDIDGAPTVVSTSALCDGEIEITNVSNDVTAKSTGSFPNSDTNVMVRVTLASIADDAMGGEITCEEGDVELTFPSEGNYQIIALANEDGTVSEGTLPADCEVSGEDPSKTIACGTNGPVYHASAGTDDSFDPGNVYITYN